MDSKSYDKVIGIDIHQSIIVACAVWTEDNTLKTEKMTFKAFSNDLRKMAEWCASVSPDLVLMESTGIFWKSPYAHLEKVGIRAAVVNARQIHQMEGKKTDMGDAEWLAHVGRLGVFSRSFIPSSAYQNLRIPSRNLLKVTTILSSIKNRFSKVFADAGFRLNLVFSNISGVNAKRVTDALIDGKSPAQILALLDLKRLKASRDQLRAAFDGELSEEHLFVLRDLRDDIEYFEQKAAKYRAHLIRKIKEIDEHGFELLQTIPGINEISAAQMLIELGGSDLSSFQTSDRLASWIGVCPGNNESAGKRRNGHTRKGNCYLRRILCECGNAAVRSKGTTFQSKYQALRIRTGTKRALVAIVHKIVRTVFVVFKNKEGYRDPKIDYDELNVLKNGKRWMKKLLECGKWKIEAQDLETGECFSNA